jgi:hypothetical protein
MISKQDDKDVILALQRNSKDAEGDVKALLVW